MGRMDEQVKIRGYRIELGEVEAALRTASGVKEAVVVARGDEQGGKYLCGYYTGEAKTEEVRENLLSRLPGYMVPARWMKLESLPLTPNGKINRRALPEPTSEETQRYLAPRDEIEAELCALFAEVLGVECVGLEDDFFSLGGHSLKAVRLLSRIKEKFRVNLKLTDLLEHRVGQLYESYLVQRAPVANTSAERRAKRFWFWKR